MVGYITNLGLTTKPKKVCGTGNVSGEVWAQSLVPRLRVPLPGTHTSLQDVF